MAHWGAAGDTTPPMRPLSEPNNTTTTTTFFLLGEKRRACRHSEEMELSGGEDDEVFPPSKRLRMPELGYRPAALRAVRSATNHEQRRRDFYILREQDSPSPGPELGGLSMERTSSGLSISSDTVHHSTTTREDASLMTDAEAARQVRDHMTTFRRRFSDSKHERILMSLIHPKSIEADFELDEAALESIFSAANELFFAGRLTRRVTWDWSHSSSAKYDSRIVGTTALRERSPLRGGGYETLIVLSSPILKDTKYNRRLLISTFLHELIHSYLFVCCGFKARHCGGHTEGFHAIADLIDGLAGRGVLYLREMEADLDRFRLPLESPQALCSPGRGGGGGGVSPQLMPLRHSFQEDEEGSAYFSSSWHGFITITQAGGFRGGANASSVAAAAAVAATWDEGGPGPDNWFGSQLELGPRVQVQLEGPPAHHTFRVQGCGDDPAAADSPDSPHYYDHHHHHHHYYDDRHHRHHHER